MKLATLWEREVGDSVLSAHFSASGEVIIVASVRTVRAYDHDGEILWRSELESDFVDMAVLPVGGVAIACKDEFLLYDGEGNRVKAERTRRIPISIAARKKIGYITDDGLNILDLNGEFLTKAIPTFKASKIIHNDFGFILANEMKIGTVETRGDLGWEKNVGSHVQDLVAEEESFYIAAGNSIEKLDLEGETIWKESFDEKVVKISLGELLLAHVGERWIFLDRESHEQIHVVHENFDVGSVNTLKSVFAKGKTVKLQEDVGDAEVYYEIMCRGEGKCGTFVSSRFVRECPKCGAKKIILRIIKKKPGEKKD